MQVPGISRRAFLRTALYATPVACVADTFWVEPTWLALRRVALAEAPTTRFVHFTDLHYKGDRKYLERVVATVNEQSPDFVCFTGDIVEDRTFLDEALDCLARLRAPAYGVPGNWDYISQSPVEPIRECFASTGGAWLRNEAVQRDHVVIHGIDNSIPREDSRDVRLPRILLTHYPADADDVTGKPYDLILAGHSHGGQCRIPFVGAVIVPDRVGSYDKGLFKTKGGPLYVNPGIGTWLYPVRFWCRPEITVFEL